MKKILFAAAACLALFSCNNKTMETPKPDAIEVTPGSYTFGEQGGTADVIVTSNADWTLEAEQAYTWVTTSKAEGQDGDVVTFTVEPNLAEDLQANFTFKSGIATATFTVFSYAGEAPVLELKSEANLSLGYEASQIEVEVSTNRNHYRQVEYALSEGADWLVYRATLPGETEADAKLYFDVKALEGLADREAKITVSVPGLEPVEVNLTQFAKHVLYTEAPRYTLAVEGETKAIPVLANVAYNITLSEGASEWLSFGEATEAGVPFTAAPLATGKRSATVTFAQTDATADETPLSWEITITQVNAIVKWAAKMTGNRLFPKWENGGPGQCSDFTLETLVKFDNFNKADGSIFTIMGIEGKYLLRMGDVGNSLTRLQVATEYGNYNTPFDFEANTWYHLAVVFSGRKAMVYVDGALKGTSQEFNRYNYYYLDKVNLSPTWSYEPSGNRCFWVGYSYENNRDTYGQMSEIRIWNKALTAEEINAENHFYEVDPASEGLFSYWKFTAGEGEYIEDATSKGNKLYGELTVVKQTSGDNVGTPGIEWVEVALPDK